MAVTTLAGANDMQKLQSLSKLTYKQQAVYVILGGPVGANSWLVVVAPKGLD